MAGGYWQQRSGGVKLRVALRLMLCTLGWVVSLAVAAVAVKNRKIISESDGIVVAFALFVPAFGIGGWPCGNSRLFCVASDGDVLNVGRIFPSIKKQMVAP